MSKKKTKGMNPEELKATEEKEMLMSKIWSL